MKTLVFGATGLIGKELSILLQRDHDVFGAVRTLNKTNIQELLLENGNIKDQQFDGVYCCLGTTIKKAKSKEAFKSIDLDMVVDSFNYAKKNGAKFFCVVSALGADSNSKIFYNKVKGQMEESLKATDMKVIIVRPSLLLGKREEFRFAEIIGSKLFSNLKSITPKKYKYLTPIKATEVAKAMIELSINGTTDVDIEFKII
jgi:uncharacterized protein YbjT (DUF2867 family)